MEKNSKSTGPIKIKDLPLDRKTVTTVLLRSIEERETKTGGRFCRFEISDGTTTAFANLWNTTREQVTVPEKTLISAEIYTKMYQGAVGYEIFRYGPAPADADIYAFIERSPLPPEDLHGRIIKCLQRAGGEDAGGDVTGLAVALYEKYREPLLRWSAAKSIHHAYYGGLLYHTYRMVWSAYNLAKVYPVDMPLLVTGAALHDIGKLKELDTDALGIADYTLDGNLFGHLLLGIQMIDEECESGDYDKERVRQLKHMIASHHGTPEFGAIAKPMTMEAMMLAQIDMLDSRVAIFENEYAKLEPGEISEKVFALDSRVYRPIPKSSPNPPSADGTPVSE